MQIYIINIYILVYIKVEKLAHTSSVFSDYPSNLSFLADVINYMPKNSINTSLNRI